MSSSILSKIYSGIKEPCSEGNCLYQCSAEYILEYINEKGEVVNGKYLCAHCAASYMFSLLTETK